MHVPCRLYPWGTDVSPHNPIPLSATFSFIPLCFHSLIYPCHQQFLLGSTQKWVFQISHFTLSALLLSISSHILYSVHPLFSLFIHLCLTQSMAVLSRLYIILVLSSVTILEASVAVSLSGNNLVWCSKATSHWLIIRHSDKYLPCVYMQNIFTVAINRSWWWWDFFQEKWQKTKKL